MDVAVVGLRKEHLPIFIRPAQLQFQMFLAFFMTDLAF
jgi:hypothetical protein